MSTSQLIQVKKGVPPKLYMRNMSTDQGMYVKKVQSIVYITWI